MNPKTPKQPKATAQAASTALKIKPVTTQAASAAQAEWFASHLPDALQKWMDAISACDPKTQAEQYGSMVDKMIKVSANTDPKTSTPQPTLASIIANLTKT